MGADVYHGAPTAVTLLISTAPKLAAFAMAMRLLVNGLFELADQWQAMLMFLAIGSIVLGNIARSRKATSSACSPIGYLPHGLHAAGPALRRGRRRLAPRPQRSRLGHVLRGRLCADEPRLLRHGDPALALGLEAENVDDFKGLNKRSPWFAAMMMFVMFSMAGAVLHRLLRQAGGAAGRRRRRLRVAGGARRDDVAGGAFHHLRVVKVMYFDEPLDAPRPSRPRQTSSWCSRPMASPSRCSADALAAHRELRGGAGRLVLKPAPDRTDRRRGAGFALQSRP